MRAACAALRANVSLAVIGCHQRPHVRGSKDDVTARARPHEDLQIGPRITEKCDLEMEPEFFCFFRWVGVVHILI